MTIERAQDWGRRQLRPANVVEVADDAAAGRLIRESRLAGAALPVVGLLGGDLRRTLGRADHVVHLDSEVAVFSVDVGTVELDETPWIFVSHLIARRRWWWGEVLAVMNAEFLGRWDVAPRSHPNDGRLDVLHVVHMTPGDRYKAWRRLATGTHLPHPAITTRRIVSTTVDLERPLPVELDGVYVGVATKLSIRVEPDALMVCL